MKTRTPKLLKLGVMAGVILGLVAGPVLAGDTMNGGPAPSAEAMAFDAVLVRPVMLVTTVLGTGLFIVSLPFSILGGNVDDAGKNLVLKPAKATFIRPLGDFE